LFEVAPGVRITVFNLLSDTEVVEAAARGLARAGDVVTLGHLPLFEDR
jgi:hypothetical protein